MSRARKLLSNYRVTHGRRFRLQSVDPADTAGIKSKDQAAKWLEEDLGRLRGLQEKLYAQSTWSLLVIFQAMDAAGKDSTIKHVMSGVNPQGCYVRAFKAPSHEELRHDFLWRTTTRLPERGQIGIFNRSYYEEVLVVRVHPELLERQHLPPSLVSKDIWRERMRHIRNHERHLSRSGTLVLKFFLHVSKKEQRKRFLERLEKADKNWKFMVTDVEERKHFDSYMSAYEDMIQNTATRPAPWYVIPADHKWYTRLIVAAAIVDALDRLDLQFPKVPPAEKRVLSAARAALLREDRS